jgi:mannose-6-phosphate isomerase
MSGATQIAPSYSPRIWGASTLSPWFPDPAVPTGEVCFSVSPDFPLLVKFIFTEQTLSIQVHPDDSYAHRHEGSRGKTEMWHILEARNDARIGLGFNAQYTEAQIREAIASCTIEDLIKWIPVQAGETYFTPAGTVHAIGAGIKLCEIQQNSDITYRLYDYGRGRELHLDHGLNVAALQPFDGRRTLPLRSDYFTAEELRYTQPLSYQAQLPRDHVLIILEGAGSLDGQAFHSGEVWHVHQEAAALDLRPSAAVRMLRAY